MPRKLNKLIIFTKSPVLGEVKTRLQPDYSPEQSLFVHKKLISHTLELTKSLKNIDVELCCAPDRNTSYFLSCENNYPITLNNQQGDDLGERMAFSMSVSLQTYEKVVVIGTDCPDINEDYINQAFAALNSNDVVIGPAMDGGYVLLGLKKFSIEIFNNISWSTDKVLSQTKKNLKNLSLEYNELDVMHDLDRPEDLRKYKEFLN
jgi:hypothetical protein